MKTVWVGLTLALLALPIGAVPTAAQPRVGEPAPRLGLEEVVSGGELGEMDLSELAGRPMVIEFWATWCGPCVGALPHWNELVAAFEGEPLVFLSVSNESERTVIGFLEDRLIAGLVAVDSDLSMFRDYAVRALPHTVLVDAEGRLRAETYPSALTEQALRKLIAGDAVDLPSATSFGDKVALRIDMAGRPDALLMTEVRLSIDPELRGLKITETEYVALGFTPLDGIVAAFEGRATRIEVDVELGDELYDFIVRSPGGHESRQRMMRRLVQEAFGVTVEVESQRKDVLVLRRLVGAEMGFAAAGAGAGGFSSYRGGIRGRGLDLWAFANALEYAVGQPVVDETGLEGRFDIDLEWKVELPGDLDRALAERGLELAPAEREIEVLVVRRG